MAYTAAGPWTSLGKHTNCHIAAICEALSQVALTEHSQCPVSGQKPWTMEYPLIEKPESIDHGPKNGFNCSGSLGFIYQAMGVHSAVINGKKQIEDIGRDEMVCANSDVPCHA